MLNKIFLLTIFFLFQQTYSQNTNSIYYGKDWKVTNKINASFYREMPLKTLGNLQLLRDFYIDGTPQFEGYILKNDENKYVGDITWYDENGNNTTFRQYVNNSENPTLTYYHGNGKIRKTAHYKNGLKDGETVIFNKEGEVLMKGVYEKGKPKSGDFETITDDYENNNSDHEPKLQKTVELEPQMSSSPAPEKTKKVYEKTITQKIFWVNSNKPAEEKVFDVSNYDVNLIAQKNYDQSGKLIQSLTENNLKKYSSKIKDGTDFQYYLQNNFATGLKSTFNYVKGEKSGKAISYFPKGDISLETNYLKGSKEGEEKIFSTNGTVTSVRNYKNDEPYTGNFDERTGNLEINSNYLNGKKEGESVAKTEEGVPVAKGIYKKGEPFKGTFITEKSSGERNELINVENFKQTGLQKVFNYRIDNLEETYTIQNEKRNGPTTFYNDDGKVTATIDYKDDEPYNGTLIEKKEITVYKNGKIETETIYKDEYSKKEDNIAKKKFYENGVLVKIADYSFAIEDQPQEFYEGIFRNGNPYYGYFVTDDNSEFQQIKYFENGNPKFQYSNNYLENMDNYRHQSYNIKSTYKDGKIFDGVEYSLQNKSFISKNLKNGIVQSFDWDLFAVNYFNRIHFEVKKNSIEINDLQNELKASLQFDFTDKNFTKKLFVNGKLTANETFSANKKAPSIYFERIIVYSFQNEKIISKSIDIKEKPLETSESTDLLFNIFSSIDNTSTSAAEIFAKLAASVGTEQWLKESNSEEIITAVRIDPNGKPKDGLLITELPDNHYKIQVYENLKLIKTVEKISFQDIQEKIKELNNW